MEKKELKKYLVLGVIVIGVCLAVKYSAQIGGFISIAFSACYPLILGCAIAYVFNIFLSFCERNYFPKQKDGVAAATRRPVCLVIALAVTALLITLLLNIVIPELITAFKLIYSEIPGVVGTIKDFAVEKLKDYPDIQEKILSSDIDWQNVAKEAFGVITVGAGGLLTSIAGAIGSITTSVTQTVIAIIFAIYLLLRKDRLHDDMRRAKNAYLSEKVNLKVTKIYHTADKTFRSFFVGQFIEAIILGSLCMLGMTILGFPYAAMTGTVIGVTALIPIVGAYFGAAIGAFMICTVDPMKALWFLLFLLILQQVEGNLIYPKVVGSSVGLPGIWVLAGVTIGGGLFGIVGMLLGVPTLATVYKLYHEELVNREKALGTYVEPQPKPVKMSRKEKKAQQAKAKNKEKK